MTLTKDLKKKALEIGLVSVGVSDPSNLKGLPYGWVGKITNLRQPKEHMPNVKSVVIMCFNTWDRAFNISIDSPKWRGYGMHLPNEEFEGYYVASEIMRSKAWVVVDYLRKKGL